MKARWVVLGMLVLMAVGCGGPVNFHRHFGVAQTFEAYQIIPEYDYYINGNSYKPTAVVALDRDITLDSPHWQKVAVDQRQLRAWVERMLEQPGAEYNIEPNGARILDDQGNQIGVWYSVWELPLMTIKSDKVISISDPMTVFPFSNRNRGNSMDWVD